MRSGARNPMARMSAKPGRWDGGPRRHCSCHLRPLGVEAGGALERSTNRDQGRLVERPADQLHAHWPAVAVKADWHVDRRAAAQGGVGGNLHPAVIAVHLPAGDLARPVGADFEGEDLRGRQRDEVEA
eukprot:gene527-740_t